MHNLTEKNVETNNDSTDYLSFFNEMVFEAVPERSVCLDVGCWRGNLGKELIQKKGCVVEGIDKNRDALDTAKSFGYKNVYYINLNEEQKLPFPIENKYDVIIFSDVLEHLIDPPSVLKAFGIYLKPGGLIIVSLPNVAFLQNRINLLLGKWNYRLYGTLDKTHLRFYTIESGRKLMENSGFNVESVTPYNQFKILRSLKLLTKFLPSVFAYQFLILARKK